jgi:hypothetical protein
MRFLRMLSLMFVLVGLLATSLARASAQDASPVAPTAPAAPGFSVADASVTIGLNMTDGGATPYGLTWSIMDASTNPWTTVQTGAIPGGVATPWQTNVSLPDGGYQYWITGNGYSSGYAMSIPNFTTYVPTLDRLTSNLAISLDTSDGMSVPSGSTWTLTDAGSTIVDSGTLGGDIPDGGSLPLNVEPVQFGDYTLAIDAAGYDSYSGSIAVTADPTAFTANLVSNAPTATTAPTMAPTSTDVPTATTAPTTVPSPTDVSNQSTFTLGVEMADASVLPYGLTWTLFGDNWTVIQTGQVPGGTPSLWSLVLPDPVAYGSYGIWITGSGYSSGQALNIQSPTSGFTFELPSLTANLTVNVNTSDSGDLPAGTTWSLADGGGTVVDSGTLSSAMSDGGTLPLTANPLIDGPYTLTIAAAGYEPYSGTIAVNADPTVFTADIVVTGQTPTESTIQYTIQTDDGSNIPAGSTWQLTQTDATYTVVDSGTVPPHSSSPFTVTIPNVPYGQYAIFFVSPDYIYYDAQVIDVETPIYSYTTTLQHRTGDLTASIATSDGAPVPDGTTWSLTDADNTIVQSGDVGDVDTLPIVNPIDYGVYVLQVTSPGYLGFAVQVVIDQPSNNVSIVLQKPAPTTGTVNLTVQTVDGGSIPSGTIITIGGVSYVVPAAASASVGAADLTNGTVIPFADVAAGQQPVAVTNADPYDDYNGTVDVVAGSTIDDTIVLQLAAATTPTPPITPVPTATTAPGVTATTTTVPGTTPTVGQATPVATSTVIAAPTKPGGGVAVKSLPNTGQGAVTIGDGWELLTLLAAAFTLLAATAFAIRNRTMRG